MLCTLFFEWDNSGHHVAKFFAKFWNFLQVWQPFSKGSQMLQGTGMAQVRMQISLMILMSYMYVIVIGLENFLRVGSAYYVLRPILKFSNLKKTWLGSWFEFLRGAHIVSYFFRFLFFI